MKFYQRWKTQTGKVTEVANPIKTTEVRGYYFDPKTEMTYIGVVYKDPVTKETLIRRVRVKENNNWIDPPNVVDTVANFHTDTLQAYFIGTYSVDEKLRDREMAKRNERNQRKIMFLKKHESEGADLLYKYYKSIVDARSDKLAPQFRPLQRWERWKKWKTRNPQEAEKLIEELKNHLDDKK